MRKKIISFIVLLLPLIVMAQVRIAEIWTQPAVFKANEQVSIYFDVSGTALEGINESEGVCVWTWFPSNPDDGRWGNPSEKTKLKKVTGNIWRLDMVPTEFYNVPAEQISAFYGQLQNYAGSKVTGAFAPDSDPPNHISLYSLTAIQGEAIIDHFPKQIKLNRPLSVLLNVSNTWPDQCGGNPVKGGLANAPNVHVHSGINGWSKVIENNPSNMNKTRMTHLGNSIYRWDIIPYEYFDVADNFPIENISMVFASNDLAYIGKGENCTDFFIEVPKLPNAPVPQLSFFPSKFSARDVFCIIRRDNEVHVNALNYTITAGSKTITGAFEGSNKEFIAYINLADAFVGTSFPEKIKVVITDNTGRKVADNDIPLVQLND